MQSLAHMDFPEIVHSTISADTAELTLRVTENLNGFSGHFDNNPILPGIVQVQWAVHFAREYLQLNTPVMLVEKLKFTHIIQPPKIITLRIQTSADKKTTRFHFNSIPTQHVEAETIAYSRGQLVYA